MKNKIPYIISSILLVYCIYLHWQVTVLLQISESQNELNRVNLELNEKQTQWLKDLGDRVNK